MYLKLIAIVLLAIITQQIYRYIFFMQLVKHEVIYKHYPGTCKVLKAEGGSEDITTLSSGTALITSGLFEGREPNILVFDFKNPTQEVKKLSIDGNIAEFRPHGISVWDEPASDKLILMVVNHAKTESVEFFQLKKNGRVLKHTKTVQTGEKHLNDIVAVSEDSFYGTQDMEYYKGNLMTHIEFFGLLRLGKVWYYDGKNWNSVLSGFAFPDGINISPDKRFLYMTDLTDKKLLTFKIETDNSLKLVKELFVDSCCDNIEVDPENGDLWIGCHPRLYAIYNYIFTHNGYSAAPSQVLKIKTEDGLPTSDITEVFLDDGNFCSASSVASYFERKMLIGTVSSQLILCDIN